MSPTPTDVSYRSGNAMDRASGHLNAPAMLKGIRNEQVTPAGEGRASRVNGKASKPSQTLTTAPSNGVGPGNMSSGISVQELKQMTALRMAQAQGHVRVVSPFPYVVGGGQKAKPGSRAPSPSHSSVESGRESGRGQGSSRSSTSKFVGNTLSENQRSRRHSISGPESHNGTSNGTSSSGSVSARGGHAGDIPPTPTSSNGSNRGGGSRRRSPSPSRLGSSPPPPSSSVPKVPSSRTSPATSSMPHGLTVQELKELTKMRLAQEAFNIPVYAVLRSSAQNNHSSSPGGPGGMPGASGPKGPAGRGRPTSPSQGLRRHQGSRSPGGGGRSTPSSPDHERAPSDRPHRRTRRGGRRGRNRSPRPDEQFSPSLGARVGGTTGSGSGGPGSRNGYSSPSSSPRERRTHMGAWRESEGQRRPRSASQPRSMTQNRSLSGKELRNNGGENCRTAKASGAADRPGDGDVPNGLREGAGSLSSLDVYDRGVDNAKNKGTNGNTGETGTASGNTGVAERYGVGPGRLSSRGRSNTARSYGGGVGHDHQWDARSRGRGSPASVEAGWFREVEKLRRESIGSETVVDRHVEQREPERVMLERARSGHLEHVYIRSGDGGGSYDEVHTRDREGPVVKCGGDGHMYRGYDFRDDPSLPPGRRNYRIQRSHSESVATVGGSRGRMGEARSPYVQLSRRQSTQSVDGPGLSCNGRQPDIALSQHSQPVLHRHASSDQKRMVSALSSAHGHDSAKHVHSNDTASNGRSLSQAVLHGGASAGVGKGDDGYDYEFYGNHSHSHKVLQHHHHHHVKPQTASALHRAGSASAVMNPGSSLGPDESDLDHDGRFFDPKVQGGVGHNRCTGAYGPVFHGAERQASSGSSSDAYRDDISHTVAESVLVTPKIPGGPVHWRPAQAPSWRSQEPPPSSMMSAASLLQDRDHNAYPSHTSSGGHQQGVQGFSSSQFSQSQRSYGSSSRHHADDRSTTSSTDSFLSMRRDLSTSGGSVTGSGSGSTRTGSVQAGALGHHQHQVHHSISLRSLHGDFRADRSEMMNGNKAHYAVGMDHYENGNHDEVLSSKAVDDSDVRMAYQSTDGPSSLGMGLGNMRVSDNIGLATSLPSESRLMSVSRFAGSAPSAFERESFPLLTGKSVGIAGLKSGLDAGYVAGPPMAGDGDAGASGASIGAGSGSGSGSGKHVSPVLSGTSPLMDSLCTTMGDDRHTPVGSPLMDGFTFPMDLGGSYGAGTGEHQGHHAGVNMGESTASDLMKFDSAGSDVVLPATIMALRTEGQKQGASGGSRTPLGHVPEGGNSLGDATSSSPSPSSSPRDDSLGDMGSELVSEVSTPNLFSYDSTEGAEEMTVLMRMGALTPSNPICLPAGYGASPSSTSDLKSVGHEGQGGATAGAAGPGTIGTSRSSNSTPGSASSSPRNIGQISTPTASASFSQSEDWTGTATSARPRSAKTPPLVSGSPDVVSSGMTSEALASLCAVPDAASQVGRDPSEL